ncbi:MAG: Gfo/Idh/MocA family oxidoreductase [Victivallaceae bacterium]|nr:Gfo/Idh/MocA family oxidoreductase [Victivallaceae bacterium]
MSGEKKLRIALIGCGNITSEHLAAFKEVPDAEIVAGCDIASKALALFRERTGLPETAVWTDWKKMLAEVKLDAVDICLPNHLHCAAALDAFAAGLHVFVEKPMALNAAECETMIAAAKQAGKKLAVGFQQEYNPATQLLVNARNNGFFGDLRYAHGLLLRRRGIPDYGVFHRRDCGGGPLMDIAVHLIDVMTYVMDRPEVERVSAVLFYGEGKNPCKVWCGFPNWNTREYDVEDLAAAQIKFRNGAVLQLTTSYVNHIHQDCVYEFDLTGSRGGAHWSPGGVPELFCDQFGAMMNLAPGWMPSQGRPEMFRRKLANFVDACRKGTVLCLPGEAGLYDQQILDAIFASAKAGREVVL